MIPSYRRDFDAAQDPRTAANALKLQPGVHVQVWDAALQSLADLVATTDNAAVRFDGTAGNVQSSALVIADTTAALTRSGNGGVPVQGTNTNDSAASGFVGEYVSSTVVVGSAVVLSANTSANVTSISLTTGDWDVSGNDFINYAATNITALECAINTASATIPTAPGDGAYTATNEVNTTIKAGIPTGSLRISLGSSGSVFLVTRVQFTVGSHAGYGFI